MLNVQEGQLCICVKSDRPWWTRGKEYEVVRNQHNELCFVDDDGTKWPIHYLKYHGSQFKRKDTSSFKKYGKLRFSMDELSDEAVERKYTTFEVTKVIVKAYQLYDNDSQRLAYIKGYFSK
jgi:hypothetical protein